MSFKEPFAAFLFFIVKLNCSQVMTGRKQLGDPVGHLRHSTYSPMSFQAPLSTTPSLPSTLPKPLQWLGPLTKWHRLIGCESLQLEEQLPSCVSAYVEFSRLGDFIPKYSYESQYIFKSVTNVSNVYLHLYHLAI